MKFTYFATITLSALASMVLADPTDSELELEGDAYGDSDAQLVMAAGKGTACTCGTTKWTSSNVDNAITTAYRTDPDPDTYS